MPTALSGPKTGATHRARWTPPSAPASPSTGPLPPSAPPDAATSQPASKDGFRVVACPRCAWCGAVAAYLTTPAPSTTPKGASTRCRASGEPPATGSGDGVRRPELDRSSVTCTTGTVRIRKLSGDVQELPTPATAARSPVRQSRWRNIGLFPRAAPRALHWLRGCDRLRRQVRGHRRIWVRQAADVDAGEVGRCRRCVPCRGLPRG